MDRQEHDKLTAKARATMGFLADRNDITVESCTDPSGAKGYVLTLVAHVGSRKRFVSCRLEDTAGASRDLLNNTAALRARLGV